MAKKPTYEELEEKIKRLEKEVISKAEQIQVSDINMKWDVKQGTCTFENLPVAMMWVDTTLAGLMSGVQAMVGTERFGLALQSEGRKSVEEDWQVISQFSNFRDGFKTIANIAAVAGWGDWELISLDENKKTCQFRVKNSWEGRYQKSLGVCWNSGMLAGKMAGYCSKLFKTNCWAKQTAFIAKGDNFDEFIVAPSERSIEMEIENLLQSDEATRADMAVALQKLREEIEDRKRAEDALRESERKYSVLVQESPDAIISLDKIGHLLSFNQAAERISGYSPEEVIGKHFAEIGVLATQSIPKALKEFALVISGIKRPPFELTIMRKDKSYLSMEANPRLIKHKGEKAWVQVTLRDITDRKQSEKEQEKLQAQLSNALEMAHLGHWEYDVADDLFTFNDHFYKMFHTTAKQVGGYTMSSAEYARRFVHPDDILVVEEEVRKAIETTDPHFSRQLEHRILYADGTIGHISVRFFIVKDSQGRTVKTYGVNQDITERKLAEEALKASEDRLKSFYDAAFEGIAVTEQGRFIDFNRQFAELFGYERNELIGREVMDLVAEEDRDLVLTNIRSDFDKPYEHKALHKDGSIMFIEVHGQNIQFKGRPARMTAINDLTKRIRAEKSLKESEEKYRMLFNSTNDAVFVHQPRADGKLRKFIEVNDVACRMYGYTREELLELTPKDLAIPEHKEDAHMRVRRLFSDRYSVFEIVHKTKDGKEIPVEVSAHLFDFHGQPTVLSVVRDITDRKQAEEKRLALELQLQQTQKMESIGTLAGGIAHDFNNILSSVFGYTELALEDAKKGTLQYENLQEILIAGNRAKDLVKQILTFSRQTDHEQKPIQMKPIVKEALKMLRASIPSTIDFKENIQSNSLVAGDSTQIHQVLMNLCTNAAHAMENDGGLLTVSLSDVELDSEFVSNHPDLKPGPYINLTVSDTGHGISPEVMEKIFDPFFTTKEKGRGTGMGLSVVHGIVRGHRGDIDVYSEPGKGSTFKVYFPVIERRLKPQERADRPIPTGKERILFIDDEPAIVNMGKRILKSLGYDVTTRTSSIEALELFKAQKSRFDLVITDLTMPYMTGEKLAEELMQIRSDIPVILCTGFSSRINEQKALDIGIRAFISKPILKREIAETIRKVLVSS